MALKAEILAAASVAPFGEAQAVTHPTQMPLAHTIPGAVVVANHTVTKTGLYKAAKEGRLTIRKFGRRSLILHDELVRFLESLPTAA